MAAVIASLLATLQLLLGALGGNVRIEQTEPSPSPIGFVVGDTSCADWEYVDREWRCPDNVWLVRISPEVPFSVLGTLEDTEEGQQRQAMALSTLVHELAHAYDAMDDGEFNGSRGHPRPDDFMDSLQVSNGRQPWEPSPWYCWAAGATSNGTLHAPPTDRARAEWYACEVARTGRLE
ncbi:MAG: hypothetical protein AB7G21_11390 [Dehalococcoidia bacterium]